MSRNKKKKSSNFNEGGSISLFTLISKETANAILGVFSLVLSIFLLMAAFGLAGDAGTVVYKWLSYFFGYGYYLLPVVFILLAVSFLRVEEREFATSQIFGSVLLFISSLGLVNLVSDEGGVVGSLISTPLNSFFHIYFSTVILSALIVISVLIIFNTAIKLDIVWVFKKLFSRKEEAITLAPLESAAVDKAVEKVEKIEAKTNPVIQRVRNDEEGFAPMIRRRSGKRWTPPDRKSVV